MSSHVFVTGHIKDLVPRIEKSRASCPGDGFLPSFIHQIFKSYMPLYMILP